MSFGRSEFVSGPVWIGVSWDWAKLGSRSVRVGWSLCRVQFGSGCVLDWPSSGRAEFGSGPVSVGFRLDRAAYGVDPDRFLLSLGQGQFGSG